MYVYQYICDTQYTCDTSTYHITGITYNIVDAFKVENLANKLIIYNI